MTISEPMPEKPNPSSHVTILFVFLTEFIIVSKSNGFKVLKFKTSALIPSCFKQVLAASSDFSNHD